MAGHVLHTPLHPNELRPDLPIPSTLSQVILKAVSKQPDDRFQTMIEFRDAIRTVLSKSPINSAEVDETLELQPKTDSLIADNITTARQSPGLHGEQESNPSLTTSYGRLGHSFIPQDSLNTRDLVAHPQSGNTQPLPSHEGKFPCPECKEQIQKELPSGKQVTFCPSCRFPLKPVAGYRIRKTLGGGGCGKVYLALSTTGKGQRAIKILDLKTSTEGHKEEHYQNMVLRFDREIRKTKELAQESQYILCIEESGCDEDLGYFYVMEYIQGTNLDQQLEKAGGRLDLKEALPIFSQLCAALSTAHKYRVVHRDIKPANVMLISQENNTFLVKLIDFGVAKVIEDSFEEALTRGFLGTPIYAAPEQFSNPQEVNESVDIYAMGALLYRMLSGEPPFMEKSLKQLVMAHVSSRVIPIREKFPHIAIPEEIEQIIQRAMAKQPDRRYPTIDAFWKDLAPWLPPPASGLSPLDQPAFKV